MAAPVGNGKRFQEGAADTVLNAVSIIGEVVEDFKNKDKFFKYKALVLLLWGISVFISLAIPLTGGVHKNEIGANLVMTMSSGTMIYAVKNDGTEAWNDIEIVVNGKWRSTLAGLEPNGNITISPTLLFDDKGKKAPSNLPIDRIHLTVGQPDASFDLLKNGQRVVQ